MLQGGHMPYEFKTEIMEYVGILKLLIEDLR